MVLSRLLLVGLALLAAMCSAAPVVTWINKSSNNTTGVEGKSSWHDSKVIYLKIIPAPDDNAEISNKPIGKPRKTKVKQDPIWNPIVFNPTPRSNVKINNKSIDYDAKESDIWPKGIVPYTFGAGEFTKIQQTWLIRAMKKLQMETCLQFIRRTDETSYIRFRTNLRTCSAPLGYTPGRVKEIQISFSRGCESLGTIQHEILHVLGLRHEHSRKDRDKYVQVFWDNIEEGKEENFDIYPNERDFVMPYDFSSVLHYSAKAFSVDPFLRQTLDANSILARRAMGQRQRASQFDIAKLNIIYNCTQSNYFRAKDYEHLGYVVDSRLVPKEEPPKVTWRVNIEAELAKDDKVYDET